MRLHFVYNNNWLMNGENREITTAKYIIFDLVIEVYCMDANFCYIT